MSGIAVIIVNYNSGSMLHECLAAIASQTVMPSRVLVMDNGSNDGSIERCGNDFPRTEMHRLGANLGFAKANNIAVELVGDCEWIALLNPDAFPEPNWLESLLEGARRYPSYSLFASCMLSAHRKGMIDGAGDLYGVNGIAWPRYRGASVAVLHSEPEEVFSPSGGAGFYRRRTFVDAGGFDERYFCYHEDVDLGFRLRLKGYHCLYLPTAVVRHVGSAIAGKGSDFLVYYTHRNMVWTFVKNMPGLYFWYYLPSHLLENLVTVGWFFTMCRGRLILRAKWDALRGLGSILKERRRVQRGRCVPANAVVKAMQRVGVLSLLHYYTVCIRRYLLHN